MTDDLRPTIAPLGDAAAVVTFGNSIDPDTHQRVLAFAAHLDSSSLPAMVEHIPSFTTVTVTYDPLASSFADFAASLEAALGQVASGESPTEGEPVEIHVCYGGEFGPDLDFVAAHNDLTPDEVVEIHSGATYVVYMIGFVPGFPYLGGMSSRIGAPRLDAPRAAVPAGSVGIAGAQTGIYPIESPGGWRLIGRTPRCLFDPRATAPSLLRAGDRVRFVPVERAAYEAALANEADA